MTALDSEVSVRGRTSGTASARDIVGAYVGLTKPRVIELLLLTTVPVMFFAERGIPALGLVAATFFVAAIVVEAMALGARRLTGADLSLAAQRKLERVEESEVCVVVSSEQNEVDKFRKTGLSIEPHRNGQLIAALKAHPFVQQVEHQIQGSHGLSRARAAHGAARGGRRGTA